MLSAYPQGPQCALKGSNQVRNKQGTYRPINDDSAASDRGEAQGPKRKPLSDSAFTTFDQASIPPHLLPSECLETAKWSSLVYAPYQHNPHKQWPQSPSFPCEKPLEKPRTREHLNSCVLRKSPSILRIYPHGFTYSSEKLLDQEQPEHLKDVERGKIEGFSKKSASRLRAFMLTHWGGDDSWPYAVTLTTQGMYDPQQWESIIKRFRTSLSRKHPTWAASWRVELQKRRTPHLHCVFWIDQALPAELLKDVLTGLWLKATREDNSHTRKHAVVVKDLVDHDAWMIYSTMHDSKAKKAQLGWKGRQWGVWNRSAWIVREPISEGTLSHSGRVAFMRRLRSYSRLRFTGKRVKPLRFTKDSNLPAFMMDPETLTQLLRGLTDE